MEQAKIQLLHPQGKKAVSIAKDTYELLKTEIVKFLTDNPDGSFTEISKAISQNFRNNNVTFEGSLNWYLEWVKLDLEARHYITRLPKTAPQKYVLSRR